MRITLLGCKLDEPIEINRELHTELTLLFSASDLSILLTQTVSLEEHELVALSLNRLHPPMFLLASRCHIVHVFDNLVKIFDIVRMPPFSFHPIEILPDLKVSKSSGSWPSLHLRS